MSNASSAFLDCLGADGPSADRAGNMHLYGWLIGSVGPRRYAISAERLAPPPSR